MDKKTRFIEIKSVDEDHKTISAYVSTYDWDRMNEKFVKGAWKLDTFKKSPVVLWAHDYQKPPIAKALNIEEDDKGLKAEMQFDEQDDFAMKIFGLYKRGFLNSFSVGFRPLKFINEEIEGSKNAGLVWIEAELLEFSSVPVPANPNATMSRAEAEIMVKTIPTFKIQAIDGTDEVKICPACDDPDNTVITPEPEKDITAEQPKAETPANLEETLKSLVEMAKMIKGKKIDEKQLSLIKLSMSALNEIVCENTGIVSKQDFEKLKEIVNNLSDFIKNKNPDAQDLVSKFMNQFEIALRGYQGK